MCAEQYESIIKIKYGDYMKLPAESERTWRHKPLEIDFEHNK
jgi:lipopolysaccharide cholinephosphotransferase